MTPWPRLALPLLAAGALVAGCSGGDGSVVVRSVTVPSAGDVAPVWRVEVDSRVTSARYGSGDVVARVTCTVRREREPRVFSQEARWPVGEDGARHRDVLEVVADADVAAHVDPDACELAVELWGLPRTEDLPAFEYPTAIMGTLLDQVTVRR